MAGGAGRRRTAGDEGTASGGGARCGGADGEGRDWAGVVNRMNTWAGKTLGLVGNGTLQRNTSNKQLMGQDYPRFGPFLPLKVHKKLAPNSRVRSSRVPLSVSPLTRSLARSRLGSPVSARPLPSSLAVAASRLGADAPPPGTPLRALGVPCSNTSPHTPIAVRPPAAAPC